MRKKLNNASISMSPIINIKSLEKTMELYKVYTKNNKLKLVYPKSLAMQLMSEMKIGEKFYFDVSEERARQWCRLFERKQWRYYHEATSLAIDNDKVKRRHRVKFKMIRNGALRCIEKVEDRLVHTDKEHSFEFRKDMVASICDANFSVRTHNCLLSAGFKYLEEIVDIPESRLFKYKNMGRKSVREIREKLKEYKQLKETE